MPRVPVLGSTNALRRGEVKVRAFGYKALVRHVRVDEPLAEGPHQVEREKGGIKVPRVLCYVEAAHVIVKRILCGRVRAGP